MLKVENLHVKFGQAMILEGIELEVKPGELVGIIGPNGCGKTTLLNAISGFAPLEAGSVLFSDDDISEWPAHKRARAGLGRSFQTAGVFREMSVEENLMIAIENARRFPWWWRFSKDHRVEAEEIIDQTLNEVDLHAHKKSLAGVLSGGQLRLLELMRLKLSGGKLFLIDEPTAGVSPIMRQALAKTIRELAADPDKSIVIIEHDLKFLFDLVDRVIVLVEGRKFLEGTPEEVQQNRKLQEVYFGAK